MEEDTKAIVPLPSVGLTIGFEADSQLLASFVTETLLASQSTGPLPFVSILFADWDHDFVAVFERQLQQLWRWSEVRVLRCGDAAEITDLARRQPFDVAIVTLNNVFGIGPSVAERVRVMLELTAHLKNNHGKPIIGLSGYFEDSDDLPERAAEAGIDVFRDRADTDDLAQIVTMYLQRDRQDLQKSP